MKTSGRLIYTLSQKKLATVPVSIIRARGGEEGGGASRAENIGALTPLGSSANGFTRHFGSGSPQLAATVLLSVFIPVRSKSLKVKK